MRKGKKKNQNMNVIPKEREYTIFITIEEGMILE